MRAGVKWLICPTLPSEIHEALYQQCLFPQMSCSIRIGIQPSTSGNNCNVLLGRLRRRAIPPWLAFVIPSRCSSCRVKFSILKYSICWYRFHSDFYVLLVYHHIQYSENIFYYHLSYYNEGYFQYSYLHHFSQFHFWSTSLITLVYQLMNCNIFQVFAIYRHFWLLDMRYPRRSY